MNKVGDTTIKYKKHDLLFQCYDKVSGKYTNIGKYNNVAKYNGNDTKLHVGHLILFALVINHLIRA